MKKPVQPFPDFLEQHGIATVAAFWWRDGSGHFGTRYLSYCCVLLVEKAPKRRARIEEVRGESAEELAKNLLAIGIEPPSVDEINRLCESAPCNPRLRKRDSHTRPRINRSGGQ